MGCIPSKHDALVDDDPSHRCGAFRRKSKPAKTKPKRYCPSPVMVEEPAPWVKGHAVFVLDKEGGGSFRDPK